MVFVIISHTDPPKINKKSNQGKGFKRKNKSSVTKATITRLGKIGGECMENIAINRKEIIPIIQDIRKAIIYCNNGIVSI